VSWILQSQKNYNSQIKCLILLLFVMGKSIPFATNNYWAFWTTYDMARLVFFVCLPIIAFVDNLRKIDLYLKIWICAHIFLAIYALTNNGKGIGGHLGDENDLALTLNMALPYAYFLCLESKKKYIKLFFLSAALFFLLSNITSLSRGGFVGMVPLLLYCWWKTPGKFKATLVAGLLLSGMLMFAGQAYWDEMDTIGDADDDTALHRRYLWGLAWQMFLDYPIMGIGPENFPWNVREYEAGNNPWGRDFAGKAVHSLYFTLLPELAIPGVILFCALLYYNRKDTQYIIQLYKNHTNLSESSLASTRWATNAPHELRKAYFIALAINGSSIGYLISGAFISVLYYPHFWLLTAITCTLKNIVDQRVKEFSYRYNNETIAHNQNDLVNIIEWRDKH
jgi:hypothetical protein